jgi:hypothetical protein
MAKARKTHASAGDFNAHIAAGCWVEVEGYISSPLSSKKDGQEARVLSVQASQNDTQRLETDQKKMFSDDRRRNL